MILVFIFILFYSLSRYYDLSDYGLSSGFRYWQLIAYNFIHLTFMHMFFNSIGYLIYKPVIAEYYGRKAPIIVIPISVILSSAIFCSGKPTFGASTIIFSMIGMYLSKIWQDGHSKRQKYKIMLLIMLIMQSIFGYNVINWKIHISALAISFILSRLCTTFTMISRSKMSWKKTEKDTK